MPWHRNEKKKVKSCVQSTRLKSSPAKEIAKLAHPLHHLTQNLCGKTATVWIQIIGVEADFDEVSSGNGEIPDTSAVPEGSCLEN